MRKFTKCRKDVTIVKLIDDKGNVFIGKAKVHPDDTDFANPRTGLIIAENRARIKRHKKMAKVHQNEIDLLKKQIEVLETARDYHLAEIPQREKFMEAYLDRKTDFYAKVKKVRENPRKLDDVIASLEGTFEQYEKHLETQTKEVIDFDAE